MTGCFEMWIYGAISRDLETWSTTDGLTVTGKLAVKIDDFLKCEMTRFRSYDLQCLYNQHVGSVDGCPMIGQPP